MQSSGYERGWRQLLHHVLLLLLPVLLQLRAWRRLLVGMLLLRHAWQRLLMDLLEGLLQLLGRAGRGLLERMSPQLLL